MKENKTYVEEADRSFYDFRFDDKDSYKVASGLTPDIIRAPWTSLIICRCRTGDLPSKA